MSEESNSEEGRLDSKIIEILKERGIELPKDDTVREEIIATVCIGMGSGHEKFRREKIETFVREYGRLIRIIDSVGFNPHEFYSEEEMQRLPNSQTSESSTIQGWENVVDPLIRKKIWEKTVGNYFKRRGCKVIVARNQKKGEDDELVSSIKKWGYCVNECTPDEIPNLIERHIGRGIAIISDMPNSPKEAIGLKLALSESFPNLPFLAAVREDPDYEAAMSHSKIQYFRASPLNQYEFIEKLDAESIDFGSSLENKLQRYQEKKNHLFLIGGPTCAGKTEIAYRVTKKMGHIKFASKMATREPRHNAELSEISPFLGGKDCFMTWEKAGTRYGLSMGLFLDFVGGTDVVLALTTPEKVSQAKELIEKRYPKRQVVVPVMITSELTELIKRFRERGETVPDINGRLKEIEFELEDYSRHQKDFWTIILNNTSYHSREELEREDRKIEDLHLVVGRFQRFIERARQLPVQGFDIPSYHNRFADDTVNGLTGYRTFDDLLKAQEQGNEICVHFSDDEIRLLLNEKDYPVEYMEYGEPRKATAIKSNGRAVLLLEPYSKERRNGIHPDTDFFSGLIENRLGKAWKKQDPNQVDTGETLYGLVKCPGMQARGGLHFAITDVFPYSTENYIYGVDVIYSKISNRSLLAPFNENDFDELRKRRERAINDILGDMPLLTK